jgi:hypothetical protein
VGTRFLGDDFALLHRGLRERVDSKEEGVNRARLEVNDDFFERCGIEEGEGGGKAEH